MKHLLRGCVPMVWLLSGAMTIAAEAGQPETQAMDEQDLRRYRELLVQGHDSPDRLLAHGSHDSHELLR